ncbi:c-type cytochrome [Roseiarcus sp.]|jgi:mono/diheme cytochrome c family protein|uniref:c-type cytochrome n=1 Tax=Roseiarcus sp. TaxID=1969460 RepID=UPI003D13FEA3
MRTGLRALLAAAALLGASGVARADDGEIARGKYLVTIGGCNDCHTPGALLGKPDFSRALGGSEVGFAIPGLGVFAGPNLTPDKETGLGNWTDDQIIAAMTAGTTPEGRRLAPIMPYAALSHLTSDDAHAIVAYLKSLPAVKNAVPGPFGPKEIPSTLVFVIVPGEAYAKMPMPP